MRTIFLLLMIAVGGTTARAQVELSWDMLAQVEFEFVHSEAFNAQYTRMIPAADILALQGQRVRIRGFMLPLDNEGAQFFLSAQPLSNCFFCGGAGPESVIALDFSNPVSFKTDDIRTLEGVFEFTDEPFQVNYSLKEILVLPK